MNSITFVPYPDSRPGGALVNECGEPVAQHSLDEVQVGSVGEPIFMVQTGAPPDEPIH